MVAEKLNFKINKIAKLSEISLDELINATTESNYK
jgi:hypothetical protein